MKSMEDIRRDNLKLLIDEAAQRLVYSNLCRAESTLMRSLILSCVVLAGCANSPYYQMTPEQKAANDAQLMRALQMMQQARPQPAAPQPSMFPQQQRCVTSQVGGQWVTNCN